MPNERAAPSAIVGQRLHLIVAYDGTPFRGWQSQAGGNTIQDHLENAFAQVAGEAVRVHGAGRTDTGVHALAQSAHVDVPGKKLAPAVWTNALNASLPPQIRIVRSRYVSSSFHARFDACGKVYRYRIINGPVLLPFDLDRAWHIVKPLDPEVLRACARDFLGRHDFAGFAANRGQPPSSSVRTIRAVRVRRAGAEFSLTFDGDGFLYKMVRLMVGAIVRCALGKDSPAELRERLRDGNAKGARLVAPASGLTLLRVRY